MEPLKISGVDIHTVIPNPYDLRSGCLKIVHAVVIENGDIFLLLLDPDKTA
jgi:hypothetical protein